MVTCSSGYQNILVNLKTYSALILKLGHVGSSLLPCQLLHVCMGIMRVYCESFSMDGQMLLLVLTPTQIQIRNIFSSWIVSKQHWPALEANMREVQMHKHTWWASQFISTKSTEKASGGGGVGGGHNCKRLLCKVLCRWDWTWNQLVQNWT